MSNIQKQHKISPAIAWLTIQKFIIFYCPLDGEHTSAEKGSLFGIPQGPAGYAGAGGGQGQRGSSARADGQPAQ